MENYPIIRLIIVAIPLLIVAGVINRQFRKTYIYLKRKKYRIDKWAVWNIALSITGFAFFLYMVNNIID